MKIVVIFLISILVRRSGTYHKNIYELHFSFEIVHYLHQIRRIIKGILFSLIKNFDYVNLQQNCFAVQNADIRIIVSYLKKYRRIS